MIDVRLYMFQCGTLACTKGDLFSDSDDPRPLEIPAPWFVISHPSGNLVIDGGNAAACIDGALAYWGPMATAFSPQMTPAVTCVAGLDRIGMALESITTVLFSHLHADHTGALGCFPQALHVVARTEYEQAQILAADPASGYLRCEVERNDLSWRLLDHEPRFNIDILGDGRVTAIPTPGHSPSHQSFLVRLASNDYVLLAHDAVYTMTHWTEEATCAAPIQAVDSIVSIRKLKRIARAHQATVVPGHDPLMWRRFRQAPYHYG